MPRFEVNDGHGSETEFEAEDWKAARKYAHEWIRDGDWGEDENKTFWIHFCLSQIATDEDGDDECVGVESHVAEIDPKEPDCVRGSHEWKTPYKLLGGLKENPGVWAHGAGVVCHEVCIHCGCELIEDSWAQDPSNGVQGLTSVEYRVGAYTEEEIAPFRPDTE